MMNKLCTFTTCLLIACFVEISLGSSTPQTLNVGDKCNQTASLKKSSSVVVHLNGSLWMNKTETGSFNTSSSINDTQVDDDDDEEAKTCHIQVHAQHPEHRVRISIISLQAHCQHFHVMLLDGPWGEGVAISDGLCDDTYQPEQSYLTTTSILTVVFVRISDGTDAPEIDFNAIITTTSIVRTRDTTYPCGNGYHVSHTLKCDGYDNCGDQSDELPSLCWSRRHRHPNHRTNSGSSSSQGESNIASSSADTETDSWDDMDDSSRTLAIVGGSLVAGLLIILNVAIILFCCCRKNTQTSKEKDVNRKAYLRFPPPVYSETVPGKEGKVNSPPVYQEKQAPFVAEHI